MASDFHSVHLCEADYPVRFGEVEGFLVETERRPFHVFLGFQHVEFAGSGGSVRDRRELIGSQGSTDRVPARSACWRKVWAKAVAAAMSSRSMGRM